MKPVSATEANIALVQAVYAAFFRGEIVPRLPGTVSRATRSARSGSPPPSGRPFA